MLGNLLKIILGNKTTTNQGTVVHNLNVVSPLFDYNRFIDGAQGFFIGDTHANWPALNALMPCIEECTRQGVPIIDTGDKVGYGANPNEVVSFFIQLGAQANYVSVAGNHDIAVMGVDPHFLPFNNGYKEIADILIHNVDDDGNIGCFHGSARAAVVYNAHLLTDVNMAYLKSDAVPLERDLEDIGVKDGVLVHSNFVDPSQFPYINNNTYIRTSMEIMRAKKKIDEDRLRRETNAKLSDNMTNIRLSFQAMEEREKRIVVLGHSHHPGVWEVKQGTDYYDPFAISESKNNFAPLFQPYYNSSVGLRLFDTPYPQLVGRHQLKEGHLYILNPGSVGQPRDFSSFATFAILRDDVFEIYKVAYDVRRTVADMVPILDEEKAGLIETISKNLLDGQLEMNRGMIPPEIISRANGIYGDYQNVVDKLVYRVTGECWKK